MYNPYDIGNGSYDGSLGEYKQIRVKYKRNRINSKKIGTYTINAGGAIIIIIFVVLCLMIFGLLSFTTSFADKKLADKNLLNIHQYYEADAKAEERLAQIYNFIYNYYEENKGDFSAYVFNGANAFDFNVSLSESEPDSEKYGENTALILADYTTLMNDIQAVSSKIKFYYDKDLNKLSYKISEWKIVFTSEFDKFQYENKNLDLVDPFE